MEIDIGDLADRTNTSTATIRFYESKGLIRSIGRKGLRRQYSSRAIQNISLIKIFQNGGMTLSQIKNMAIDHEKIKIKRDQVREAKNEIKDKIETLNNLLLILTHVEKCPYDDHLQCPDFLKLLDE
ncbi:MerR family transcriptional regulator [Acinetobacter sp. DSM 11652]|uniref:MerR family transcriptional regulator n=1 Tax=Acinetobacter sp. DSM 11652 TaxID=346222 RepID=UPI0008BF20F7|nr:MerR family transcriptional regulator [Acinetobacter sp. DSM 11652]SEL22536.1 DNA-binding transcriptional regulator, MerR family [Acinetobacter sp. DSM 11652]